jgi:hypothetical protein
MSSGIMILCHENPEFPNRTFAFGKNFDKIVYCVEVGCKNKNIVH